MSWFLLAGFVVYSIVLFLFGMVIGYSKGQDEAEDRWSAVAAKARRCARYGVAPGDPNDVFFAEISRAALRSAGAPSDKRVG